MPTKQRSSATLNAVKRAFVEFLTLPTLSIVAFLALAFISYSLDKTQIDTLEPLRAFLKKHVFANPKATSDLLAAIAAGIISVTSLTITLLLIVVQQSAASMTAQVFDQFLRRRMNQVYFGFFVGLALYSLITLATVNDPFNPVWGGTLAFVLTVIGLYLLVLLLYTTIDQMRPVEIIEAIHDHILTARKGQAKLIRQTRRAPAGKGKPMAIIKSEKHGYVTRLNVEAMAAALAKAGGEPEVVLQVSLGTYVGFGDVLAHIRTTGEPPTEALCDVILNAVHLDRQRDIDTDAAYGIEQLQTIGWTSISTAKSNPAPGMLAIRSLRDILARWAAEAAPEPEEEKLPVVYTDNAVDELMDTFETLAVVTSESMQHQNFIELIVTLDTLFGRLPKAQQDRAENITLRILPALGDHVLTLDLEEALSAFVATLQSYGKAETARAVQMALLQLSQSVGKLNSRATRVPHS